MADNPAAQSGFNPRYPFLDPIQGWIEGHKNEIRQRGVNPPPDNPEPAFMVTALQVVVMGLLKRVTDLEQRNLNVPPNVPRGGRTRRRRHTRVLGVQ